MRIINKKYLLIILLVGIIITGVIILKPKENVQLDNVILKQEVNNKAMAMYKEEGESYVPVEGTKFPEGYVLNISESKCIDNNGNELSGVLSYENGNVTITSGKTIYCYLYFDKTLGVEIKDKNPNGLKTDKVRGEMYRFQGQAKDENGNELVDNYICFGTSDKDTCTSDTDHYMYRIIGIEASTGRVKVIKKEALNNSYPWYLDSSLDIKWPNSTPFNALNGDDFLNNDNYLSYDWQNKIANNTWIYGDMLEHGDLGANQVGDELYLTEFGKKLTEWYEYSLESPNEVQLKKDFWNESKFAKISLMYVHDYYYSLSDNANCQFYRGEDLYDECKSSWMHLSNNDTSAPSVDEWTMVRFGTREIYHDYRSHFIHNTGYEGVLIHHVYMSLRPVFYINATEELLSETGNGTIDDPFILK